VRGARDCVLSHDAIQSRSIAISVLVGVAVLLTVFVQRKVESAVLKTHTVFLFAQLDESYCGFLASGNTPVQSEKMFLDLVRRWPIDWNSCQFRDGVILDSWGTTLEARIDGASVHLCSAGADRRFNTSDDVEITSPSRDRNLLPSASDH
jgi:hypothetical protein